MKRKQSAYAGHGRARAFTPSCGMDLSMLDDIVPATIAVPGSSAGMVIGSTDGAAPAGSSSTASSSGVNVDSGTVVKAGRGYTPARKAAPVASLVTRSSISSALDSASSVEARQTALARLNDDMFASSSRQTRQSWWNTWCRLHHAWFGDAEPVTPLTSIKILAIASMFKSGGYVSFSNYAARAKYEHMATFNIHQIPWSEELARTVKDATRSVTRGVGSARQSEPFDLGKVCSLGIVDDAVIDGGPIGPVDFLILGCFFLTREIELSCTGTCQLQFNHDNLEVSWHLPVSKNDPRAMGTWRTWGCVCIDPYDICRPYHAALRQCERVRSLAASKGLNYDMLPLFPDSDGGEISKAKAVSTLIQIVGDAGSPTTDSAGRQIHGGHSLRTAGAVMLASLGMDSTKIEVMARWRSPMLIRYARSSPVIAITREFIRLKTSDSDSCDTTRPSRQLMQQVRALATRLDDIHNDISNWHTRIGDLENKHHPIQYVHNTASGIWHRSLMHDVLPPHRRKAVCGWQYMNANYGVVVCYAHPSDNDGVPISIDSFCHMCCKPPKAATQAEAIDSD